MSDRFVAMSPNRRWLVALCMEKCFPDEVVKFAIYGWDEHMCDHEVYGFVEDTGQSAQDVLDTHLNELRGSKG